jgi:hypothetical protein
VKSGERNQVDSQFSKVRVKLTRESKAAGDSRHGSRDEMVKISVGGSSKLESSETDIVESFVVNDHALISILDQLMDRESGVIRFNDSI